MASALTISDKQLTAKTAQKFAKLVDHRRSRLNIHGGVPLYSLKGMHDPSFKALALIVSEKLT